MMPRIVSILPHEDVIDSHKPPNAYATATRTFFAVVKLNIHTHLLLQDAYGLSSPTGALVGRCRAGRTRPSRFMNCSRTQTRPGASHRESSTTTLLPQYGRNSAIGHRGHKNTYDLQTRCPGSAEMCPSCEVGCREMG